MTPHLTTLILAIVLIVCSAWGYLGSETPSVTALIPGGFGLLLLACYPGVKRANKVASHVAVVLVVVVALALLMPLKGAIGREDGGAIVRVGLMLSAAIVTIISYVRSFRRARQDRQEE